MRWRRIVFLPPATVMTMLVLSGASSLVSTLETTFAPRPLRATALHSVESDCSVLRRKIREMSRRATGCDADLRCLGSPILCPVSMDATLEREYRELLRDLDDRCLPTSGSVQLAEVESAAPWGDCRSSPDGVLLPDDAYGAGPATFVF